MTKAKISPPINDFVPPFYLDRRGKRHFRQIIAGVRARGGSIREAEATSIVDFVSARQRVELLTIELNWRRRSRSPTTQDRSYTLALARQIDATAATSRRLAKALGI